MTTRLQRTSTKSPRKVYIQALCPACAATKRCLSVGTGTVDGQRREILRCTEKSCETEFLPRRRHIPNAAA